MVRASKYHGQTGTKKPEKKTYWTDFSQWFDEMQECKTLK